MLPLFEAAVTDCPPLQQGGQCCSMPAAAQDSEPADINDKLQPFSSHQSLFSSSFSALLKKIKVSKKSKQASW